MVTSARLYQKDGQNRRGWVVSNLSLILLLAVLGLCCCVRAFSSCRKWGPFSSRGAQAFHLGGSCCTARARGCAGFSRWGTWAYLLHGMWNLSGRGIEPMPRALAGRFFRVVPSLEVSRMQTNTWTAGRSKKPPSLSVATLEGLRWCLNLKKWLKVCLRST